MEFYNVLPVKVRNFKLIFYLVLGLFLTCLFLPYFFQIISKNKFVCFLSKKLQRNYGKLSFLHSYLQFHVTQSKKSHVIHLIRSFHFMEISATVLWILMHCFQLGHPLATSSILLLSWGSYLVLWARRRCFFIRALNRQQYFELFNPLMDAVGGDRIQSSGNNKIICNVLTTEKI